MNKYRFLKFIKYKEPPKINININTIKLKYHHSN